MDDGGDPTDTDTGEPNKPAVPPSSFAAVPPPGTIELHKQRQELGLVGKVFGLPAKRPATSRALLWWCRL